MIYAVDSLNLLDAREYLAQGTLTGLEIEFGKPLKIRTLIILITLGILSDDLIAKEGRSLTIQQAVAVAVENNLDLRRSNNQLQISDISLTRSQSEYLPTLNLNTSTGRYFSSSSPMSNLSTSLNANVNLFKGFSDRSTVEQQSHSLNAARFGADHLRQSLTLQVCTTFLDVVTRQELVQVATDNLLAERSQLTLTQGFYEAGKRAIADLYQQQAAVAQAELDSIVAQNNLQVARLELARKLGISLGSDTALTSPAAPALDGDLIGLSLAGLKEEAMKNRSDLQEQAARITAASSSVKLSRAGYWPSLNLNASTGSSYRNDVPGSFSDQYTDRNLNSNFGFTLSLPIYDHSRTSLGVQQSILLVDQERIALEDKKRQIELEVEQAWLNYEGAIQQLRVSEAQEKFARQSLDAMTERYRVGASAMIELTQARSLHSRAIGNRIGAQNRLITTRLTLGYAVGAVEEELKNIQ
jgi:outer membrane protein